MKKSSREKLGIERKLQGRGQADRASNWVHGRGSKKIMGLSPDASGVIVIMEGRGDAGDFVLHGRTPSIRLFEGGEK